MIADETVEGGAVGWTKAEDSDGLASFSARTDYDGNYRIPVTSYRYAIADVPTQVPVETGIDWSSWVGACGFSYLFTNAQESITWTATNCEDVGFDDLKRVWNDSEGALAVSSEYSEHNTLKAYSSDRLVDATLVQDQGLTIDDTAVLANTLALTRPELSEGCVEFWRDNPSSFFVENVNYSGQIGLYQETAIYRLLTEESGPIPGFDVYNRLGGLCEDSRPGKYETTISIVDGKGGRLTGIPLTVYISDSRTPGGAYTFSFE